VQLRSVLQIQSDEQVVFERYSDSAAAYVTLDADKPQVYKTLFRAAKAKLKLRLKATIPGEEEPVIALPAAPTFSHVTLPSGVPSMHHRLSAETLAPQAHAPVSPAIARSPKAKLDEPASPVSPPKAADAQAEAEGEAPVPQSFTARQGKHHAHATSCATGD
jgi:next-to-BRCA1 protein 1